MASIRHRLNLGNIFKAKGGNNINKGDVTDGTMIMTADMTNVTADSTRYRADGARETFTADSTVFTADSTIL
ncbi:hypothetical protein ACOKFD_15615 [Flagellimonas sp. S174]|uniref:hypothetical protein n=1 Tax=Flagellimonas sp. S174 TaxID=3410790 RepID=UPI003BF5B2C5